MLEYIIRLTACSWSVSVNADAEPSVLADLEPHESDSTLPPRRTPGPASATEPRTACRSRRRRCLR